MALAWHGAAFFSSRLGLKRIFKFLNRVTIKHLRGDGETGTATSMLLGYLCPVVSIYHTKSLIFR